ncbi:MAG TPA: hypothetical protein VK766_01295, partial [Cytophagaceae bacterium]|nr:hypothetical protein [Cytophagaceae bacterium]
KNYLFLLLLCIVGYSCRYDNLNEVNPSPASPCASVVPDTVSFSKNIAPLLSNSCATPGCHSGSYPPVNLNLESANSYAQLSKPGGNYINTVNPTQSVLYKCLVATYSRMPPTEKLDDCELELITRWMQQNAKNN